MGPSVDDGPDERDHHADMNSNRSTTIARITAAIKGATHSPWFGFFRIIRRRLQARHHQWAGRHRVPPAAGTYDFRCDVHPQMTGTLVVQ